MTDQNMTSEQITEQVQKIYAKYHIAAQAMTDEDIRELSRLIVLGTELDQAAEEPPFRLGLSLVLRRAAEKLGFALCNKLGYEADEPQGVIGIMTPKERPLEVVSRFFGLSTTTKELRRTIIGTFFVEDGQVTGNVLKEENVPAMQAIAREAGLNVPLIVTFDTTDYESMPLRFYT